MFIFSERNCSHVNPRFFGEYLRALAIERLETSALNSCCIHAAKTSNTWPLGWAQNSEDTWPSPSDPPYSFMPLAVPGTGPPVSASENNGFFGVELHPVLVHPRHRSLQTWDGYGWLA